jgi:hypothetical protein
MSKRAKLPISLIAGSVLLSFAFTPTSIAQNLSPLQLAISSQVKAVPDPPPPTSDPINAVPFSFDPFHTNLVEGSWETGIGCPTNATTNDGTTSGTYTDPACPTGTGDPKDSRNEGLLLVKTGPTGNFAAAGARLVGPGVKGVVLGQVGYDIRKPGANISDPRGSHCGAGAPRFNISSGGHLFFLGCASPPPDMDMMGTGWQRLRWGSGTLGTVMAFSFDGGCGITVGPCAITGPVDSISIIFDEGQDASGGPDQTGLAVIDNIVVNNSIAGKGPAN